MKKDELRKRFRKNMFYLYKIHLIIWCFSLIFVSLWHKINL